MELSPRCRICGAGDGTPHVVREMMFGSRARFEYFRCAGCGCLQLVNDVDLESHYPPQYHSYQPQPRPNGLRARLRKLRNAGVFRGHPIGRMLAMAAPYPVYAAERWLGRMNVTPTTRILDVGCGSGELVRDLVEAGFLDAHGIDPFLPENILAHLPHTVRKARLDQVAGDFDVVMLHHVLEHVPDPLGVLAGVVRVLRPGGYCLVRIPVIPSFAWDRYRENWVQLDAPRHVFVHSEKSLSLLAARAGLHLEHMEYDSTEFQFTGSELYARDVPLGALNASYTASQLRGYRRTAKRLNRERRGDQAAFYLRKPG
jgi:SAM-dependent methyltransferase